MSGWIENPEQRRIRHQAMRRQIAMLREKAARERQEFEKAKAVEREMLRTRKETA